MWSLFQRGYLRQQSTRKDQFAGAEFFPPQRLVIDSRVRVEAAVSRRLVHGLRRC